MTGVLIVFKGQHNLTDMVLRLGNESVGKPKQVYNLGTVHIQADFVS